MPSCSDVFSHLRVVELLEEYFKNFKCPYSVDYKNGGFRLTANYVFHLTPWLSVTHNQIIQHMCYHKLRPLGHAVRDTIKLKVCFTLVTRTLLNVDFAPSKLAKPFQLVIAKFTKSTD